MIVWVAAGDVDHEGEDVFGIFSTKELAEKSLKQYKEENQRFDRYIIYSVVLDQHDSPFEVFEPK